MTQQIRSSLDKDLDNIQDMILRMGSLLNRQLSRAMQAIEDLDEGLARSIVADDQHLNDLRHEVEQVCHTAIARHQPAAGDLRQIVAAMNIVLDLERMGDHAAGIAKTVLRMKDEQGDQSLPAGLMQMYELARSMLLQVMEVYGAADAKRAREIAAMDDQIDDQYRALFRQLLESMVEKPGESERALYLLFSGHNLERVADRVTNIAERVVFMKSGEMRELNVESTEPEGAG